MSAELEASVNALLDALSDEVQLMRRRYPLDDYAARVYHCGGCDSIDGAVGPAAELVDDYPCPECGRPQLPILPVGRPTRPNRAARRSTRRRP
jgi:hypothetical protein